MKLGIFANGWWTAAADQLGYSYVTLPIADNNSNPHAADLNARLSNGQRLKSILAEQNVDVFLDNSGAGLAFLRPPENPTDLRLAHESLGKLLCSHFIDPITTVFQGLEWGVAWQCLQSTNWLKGVWDRALVHELQSFGVPNVVHLPMAAPVREYVTTPIQPSDCTNSVSFIGGQNTSYFHANASVPSSSLFAGVLAHAIRGDMPGLSFNETYHDLYQLAEPVVADEDMVTRVRKTWNYYQAKLFFHAALCIRNRDRFVIFLKKKLGAMFRLIGTRWDAEYGLSCESPLPTTDQYFDHFRKTAININLVNGNAETGLNMRHFEITAAGGFMLCYDQPELCDHFVIGKECDVFRNEAELLDKTHYYLAHPEERCAIAHAGQQRTLAQHLYSHRLTALLSMIKPKEVANIEFATNHCNEDFRKLLPNPDIILDCGANIGQMARGLRALYPKATIYSFEPVSAVYDQLCKLSSELRLNPVRKAVCDRNGKALIHLTTSPEAHSLLEFQEGNPCARWTQVVGREEIDVCTLDQWCEDNDVDPKRVGLLKLDVQGAELQALYGARLLLKHVRLVYLEVAFVPIYKDCPLLHDIDGFMSECGFRRYAIYPSDQPHNWGDALYVNKRLEI